MSEEYKSWLKLRFRIDDGTKGHELIPFHLESFKRTSRYTLIDGLDYFFSPKDWIEVKYKAPDDFSEYLIRTIRNKLSADVFHLSSYSEGKDIFGTKVGEVEGPNFKIKRRGKTLSIRASDVLMGEVLNVLYDENSSTITHF